MSISLATKDFVQGGLLSDVDVLVKQAEFVVYNYDGKATVKDPPLALKLVLSIADDESEHTEYITAGSSRDFVPNPEDDGNTIAPNGSAKNLRKGSNLFLFNESLEAAGFPQAKLVEGKAKNYEGVKFHLERRAAPKRQGLKDQSDTNEAGYEKTYVACQSLISTPWDKSGQKGKAVAAPKAKATAAPAPAADTDSDVDAEVLAKASEFAMTLLSDAVDAGKIKTAQYKMKLFKLMGGAGQEERNEMANVATSADVLGPMGWAIKGDEIVLS